MEFFDIALQRGEDTHVGPDPLYVLSAPIQRSILFRTMIRENEQQDSLWLLLERFNNPVTIELSGLLNARQIGQWFGLDRAPHSTA